MSRGGYREKELFSYEGFYMSLSIKGAELITNQIFPVPMRLGETPVPIPNTMVKP